MANLPSTQVPTVATGSRRVLKRAYFPRWLRKRNVRAASPRLQTFIAKSPTSSTMNIQTVFKSPLISEFLEWFELQWEEGESEEHPTFGGTSGGNMPQIPSCSKVSYQVAFSVKPWCSISHKVTLRDIMAYSFNRYSWFIAMGTWKPS